MATPTPGRPAPSQAVATPPVSTPFSHHPAFSPRGPRSVVPSPQQFKKSPANSNTLYGYPSGGGHPTNSSFGATYDSPSAAIALGGVPGLAELGLDGMGAPALNALGSLGRGDEDEKKRRMQQVLEILQVCYPMILWIKSPLTSISQSNKGKLSEAGIDRLAKRIGLDTQWMSVSRTQKNLIIAGSLMVIEITFSTLSKSVAVEEVTLSMSSLDIVEKHMPKAGDILLRDLQIGPSESPLTKSLDKLAANLERLAALDKLSITPGFNCYEAIAGIYESVERLHKWEISRLKEQEDMAGRDEDYISRTALCRKSGRPVMHARGRVGMSLDYWQEKHGIPVKDCKGEERKIWTLLVECGPPPPLAYLPARMSEKWISEGIKKENPAAEDLFLGPDGHTPLDWLEPDNTLLPSTDPPKSDAMDLDQTSHPKYPEVVFVAKFEPPLVVTYHAAAQIYHQINTQMVEYQTATFDGLTFPQDPGEKAEMGEARTVKQQTAVPVYSKDGEKSIHIHKNTLFFDKIEYGFNLTELPFSHPRQLVEMLPTIRQYSLLHSILDKSFGPKSKHIPENKANTSAEKSTRDKFVEFMAQTTFTNEKELAVDVTLTISSIPRLQVVFPFKNRTANVIFDIKLNGVVELVAQNVLGNDSGKGKGKMLNAADLGKMLEVCEDLGIWAEFVRGRLG